MMSCGSLLRIFLAILLGICVFSCDCEAASVCSLRAVRKLTSEGVKCVCNHPFYGENCQFRAHNFLAINAAWTGMNEARVQWQTEERIESFHLIARKVVYDVSRLAIIYGKWKSRALNVSGRVSGDVLVEDRMNGNNEDGIMKGVAVFLRLDQAFTWEFRVIKNENKNQSGAVFIDPPGFEAYEQAFGFIKFFEDFNTPSFNKGTILGMAIGVLGTFIFSAVIYSVVRLCCRRCKKEKNTKSHRSFGTGNQDNSTSKFPGGSTVIEISEMDTLEKKSFPVESQLGHATSVKSVFVTIPEVIEIVPKSASVLW